eukprot:COSAG02_NODE_261_length_26663_cov_210.330899_22_plen_72_part_00
MKLSVDSTRPTWICTGVRSEAHAAPTPVSMVDVAGDNHRLKASRHEDICSPLTYSSVDGERFSTVMFEAAT